MTRAARRRRPVIGAVLVLALAVVLAAACKPRPGRGPAGVVRSPAGAAAPAAPAPAGSDASGLRVTLSWSAPVDLDLYVTGPDAETVYFGHTPTARGHLVADRACGGPAGERIETVVVPAPPPGTYRVGVDYLDACGTPVAPAAYRIAVEGATAAIDHAGTAEPDRFAPVVVELAVAAAPTPIPPARRTRRRR